MTLRSDVALPKSQLVEAINVDEIRCD